MQRDGVGCYAFFISFVRLMGKRLTKIKSAGLSSILPISVVLILLLSACATPADESDQPVKPIANITSPASNSNLNVGQELLITFNVADIKGVNQIELMVDGQPVMVETVDPPVNSYTASHRWTAEMVGSHVIELRAFNVVGLASDPVQIFFFVGDALAEATPTPPVEDTATPTVVMNRPSLPPAPTSTPVQITVEPTRDVPMVTAVVRLNVRLGPSTDYPVLGQLNLNEAALITGRDQFSTWWQIEFSSDSGEQGWVAAGSDFSTANGDVAGVPVVEAPLLEEVVSTGSPPSPSPTALKPTIFSFTADRYTIGAGERVVLKWDLADAQVAYLRYDDIEEGVVAPGSKTVMPDKETKYTLIARNEGGETYAEVIINVTGPGPTPVSILRDGKIRIVNAQFIDFDQGLVQTVADVGTDFQWDGQAKRFIPLGGALGTLLSRPYGEIAFVDCQTASYDRPISGVDGSVLVTGCYITSEGRNGKFSILEWDSAFNLTIEWQTWNYP